MHNFRGDIMDIVLQRILELIDERGHGEGTKLANAINLPQNSITEWRKGRKKSYVKYVKDIAGYYNVSSDWIYGKTDDREIKKAPTEGECNKQEVLREALKDYISDTMGKVDDETVDRVLDFTAIYLALLGGQKDEQ